MLNINITYNFDNNKRIEYKISKYINNNRTN